MKSGLVKSLPLPKETQQAPKFKGIFHHKGCARYGDTLCGDRGQTTILPYEAGPRSFAACWANERSITC